MRSLIISIFCVILTYGSLARAECVYPTYKNISQNVKNLVFIYTKNTSGKFLTAGAGFVIKQDIIVTALHVVDHPLAIAIFVRIKDNNTTTVKKVMRHMSFPRYDLAYLHVKYKFKSWVDPRVAPLVSGEPVYSLGYPLIDRSELPLGITLSKGFGRFLKLYSSVHLHIKTQLTTIPIIFGNSGGPVFDADGRLIGMVRNFIQFGNRIFPGYAFTESIDVKDILKNLPKKLKKPRK